MTTVLLLCDVCGDALVAREEDLEMMHAVERVVGQRIVAVCVPCTRAGLEMQEE